MFKRSFLKAESILDIHILSALIEKAIICKKWIKYDKKEKILTLLINRFCWELDNNLNDNIFFRTLSHLTFHNVIEAKDFLKDGNFKKIFGVICCENNQIKIILNNDYEVFISVEDYNVTLEDTQDCWTVTGSGYY